MAAASLEHGFPGCRSLRLLLLPVVSATCFMATEAAAAEIAVVGETIHTMAGPAIKNGVILIKDGEFQRVGSSAEVRIPDGYRRIEARVVTPGLIDAHSVVGLTGYLNQEQDQDQLDHSDPIQPELRAIDAYNPQERLIEWIRGFGVTTIHTGHAPGELISGQTMIVKTTGNTVEDALIIPTAMIAASLGEQGVKRDDKSPGTRSKVIAMLRAQLIKAREYLKKQEKADQSRARKEAESASSQASEDDAAGNDEKKDSKPPDRDLRLEALGRVLKGEIPLLVTVHRAHDIVTLLRLAKEFDIPIILDGAAEAYLVIDEIKAAGVPVLVHPTMMRSGRGETENASFETAAKLRAAGIPIAMQSGYESYVPKTRVVLFEAAVAAANGLSFDDALASCTIDAARILKVADRVGSIEPGKDADLALFDGDPFEYTTHCTSVVINGELVSEASR